MAARVARLKNPLPLCRNQLRRKRLLGRLEVHLEVCALTCNRQGKSPGQRLVRLRRLLLSRQHL